MTPAQDPVPAAWSRLLVEVPPFRPVAVRLMNMMGDPSVNLGQVVQLLRSDAPLTTDLLRVANSPLLAVRVEIKNILQALSYLGVERVHGLIMTSAMKALVDTSRCASTQACWRHNLATALISRRLAASWGLLKEECYLAGLIHDIGRMAMLRAFQEYEGAMLHAAAEGLDLCGAEKSLLGFDHCEAGSWILARRDFPLELQIVAAQHEHPSGVPGRAQSMASLVGTSCQVANSIGLQIFPSPSPPQLPEIAAKCSERTRNQLFAEYADIAEETATKVNGVEQDLL